MRLRTGLLDDRKRTSKLPLSETQSFLCRQFPDHSHRPSSRGLHRVVGQPRGTPPCMARAEVQHNRLASHAGRQRHFASNTHKPIREHVQTITGKYTHTQTQIANTLSICTTPATRIFPMVDSIRQTIRWNSKWH